MQVGLESLIASSTEEYVAIAVRACARPRACDGERWCAVCQHRPRPSRPHGVTPLVTERQRKRGKEGGGRERGDRRGEKGREGGRENFEYVHRVFMRSAENQRAVPRRTVPHGPTGGATKREREGGREGGRERGGGGGRKEVGETVFWREKGPYSAQTRQGRASARCGRAPLGYALRAPPAPSRPLDRRQRLMNGYIKRDRLLACFRDPCPHQYGFKLSYESLDPPSRPPPIPKLEQHEQCPAFSWSGSWPG